MAALALEALSGARGILCRSGDRLGGPRAIARLAEMARETSGTRDLRSARAANHGLSDLRS